MPFRSRRYNSFFFHYFSKIANHKSILENILIFLIEQINYYFYRIYIQRQIIPTYFANRNIIPIAIRLELFKIAI